MVVAQEGDSLRLSLGGSLGSRLQEKPEKLVENSALESPPSLLTTPSGLSHAQGEAQTEGQ